MKKYFLLFGLLAGLFTHAETTFEGYYKIENDGRHVGFAVKRTEYDAAKRTRTIRFFIHTTDRDRKNHQIHFVTVSTSDFHPLESDYFETVDGKTEHEQLKFNDKFYQNVFQNKTGKQSEKWPLKQDMMLSSTTLPVLMFNHLVKGKVYSYDAIRESDGRPNHGQIYVLDMKTFGATRAYRVYDDYEMNPVETWITPSGEVLKEIVPARKVTATLVKDADTAIGAIEFNRSELVKVFNEIPSGTKNDAATRFPDFNEKYSQKYKQEPTAIPLHLVDEPVSK